MNKLPVTNDRVLVGAGAVGASVVVVVSKYLDVVFTEIEYGIMVAGATAVIGFAVDVFKHYTGMKDE